MGPPLYQQQTDLSTGAKETSGTGLYHNFTFAHTLCTGILFVMSSVKSETKFFLSPLQQEEILQGKISNSKYASLFQENNSCQQAVGNTYKTGLSARGFSETESKAFWHVQQDGHNLCLCRQFKGSQWGKVFLIVLFAFSEHLTRIKSLKLCRANFKLSI